MKIPNTLIAAIILIVSSCNQAGTGPVYEPVVPASIIFVGDSIVTVDELLPYVDAVAVRGEDIIAVGAEADIMALRGDETRVIRLGDRALVPGFIDAHGHLAVVARLIDYVNLSSPPVGPVDDMDDLVALISEHIANRSPEPGEWIYGYGYDDSLIAENRHPTRDDLDRASTEHPIALMHVSGHFVAVNSAALKVNGVDDSAEDPSGGVIRRRPGTREPNGVMEEAAAYPFFAEQFQDVDPIRLEGLIRKAVDLYASFGTTTIQDGGASLSDIGLFQEAAARKAFPVDIVAFPMANLLDDATIDSIQIQREYSGGFRVGGIKFSLDGSPQGRTAYLSRPYTEGPLGAAADYRAYPTYPAEKYNRRILRLIRNATPVLVHANGDAAIDMMIAGVADAIDGIEKPDHRTVIIHAQLTREDQLKKIKELGIVPSYYSAHPFFWGDWHRKSFGEKRAAFISPVGRSVELGIPFTVHNDAPVVPPDIMRLLGITVNRKTRSGFILGPEQRATPLQALQAVTINAAYQYFEEDRKGSITPGKRADLVVLGANPLTVDHDTIKDIPIIETFARGRSVYRQN